MTATTSSTDVPPEFPREEYDARLDQLHRAMHARGVDAVLLADEQNQRYFAGHYTELWSNPARPMACWIERDHAPTLVVQGIQAEWARTVSCAERVVVYDGPSATPAVVAGSPVMGFEPDFAEALIGVGRSFGLGRSSRVGIPRETYSRLNMSVAVYEQLKDALSCEWVDVADVLWNVRVIKSPAELDHLRRAVDVLDHAYADFFRDYRREWTEIEAVCAFRGALHLRGAEHLGYVNLVRNVGADLFSEPTARRMPDSGLMFIDAGAVVSGYWSDYSRVISLGPPDAAHRKVFDGMVQALEAGIAEARPGRTTGDVARAILSKMPGEFAGRGFGRVGHSIGLQQPEPPSLTPSDTTELRPGMVFCIEPVTHVPGVGVLIIEDMFVVTEDGCRTLATAPERPWEIAVID